MLDPLHAEVADVRHTAVNGDAVQFPSSPPEMKPSPVGSVGEIQDRAVVDVGRGPIVPMNRRLPPGRCHRPVRSRRGGRRGKIGRATTKASRSRNVPRGFSR